MHAISNRLVSLKSDNILISTIFSCNLMGTCQSLRRLDLEKEIGWHRVCLIQFDLIQIKLKWMNILVYDFLLLRSVSSHLAKIFLIITCRRIGVVGGGRIFAQIRGVVWVSGYWNCTLGRYGRVCWSDLTCFNHKFVCAFVLLCVLWLWLVTWILIYNHIPFLLLLKLAKLN